MKWLTLIFVFCYGSLIKYNNKKTEFTPIFTAINSYLITNKNTILTLLCYCKHQLCHLCKKKVIVSNKVFTKLFLWAERTQEKRRKSRLLTCSICFNFWLNKKSLHPINPHESNFCKRQIFVHLLLWKTLYIWLLHHIIWFRCH